MSDTKNNEQVLLSIPLKHNAVISDAQPPLRLSPGELAHVPDAAVTKAIKRNKDMLARRPIEMAQFASGRIGEDVGPAGSQSRSSRFAASAEMASPRR